MAAQLSSRIARSHCSVCPWEDIMPRPRCSALFVTTIIAIVLLVVLMVSPVFALVGILVSQYNTPSVTGRLVWVCTYSVGGANIQVVLERICPPTMDF